MSRPQETMTKEIRQRERDGAVRHDGRRSGLSSLGNGGWETPESRPEPLNTLFLPSPSHTTPFHISACNTLARCVTHNNHQAASQSARAFGQHTGPIAAKSKRKEEQGRQPVPKTREPTHSPSRMDAANMQAHANLIIGGLMRVLCGPLSCKPDRSVESGQGNSVYAMRIQLWCHLANEGQSGISGSRTPTFPLPFSNASPANPNKLWRYWFGRNLCRACSDDKHDKTRDEFLSAAYLEHVHSRHPQNFRLMASQ